MKFITISVLSFILFCLDVQGKSVLQIFDKSAYYAVMAAGKMEQINHELKLLNTDSINEKDAYIGALLMRKAGLEAIPAEKLRFFKTGRIKLESSLLKDSENGELHFLRLMIQEHAPKIVKYSTNLESDKLIVRNTFNTLSPVVQQAIIDYSKNSNILHTQDFHFLKQNE